MLFWISNPDFILSSDLQAKAYLVILSMFINFWLFSVIYKATSTNLKICALHYACMPYLLLPSPSEFIIYNDSMKYSTFYVINNIDSLLLHCSFLFLCFWVPPGAIHGNYHWTNVIQHIQTGVCRMQDKNLNPYILF